MKLSKKKLKEINLVTFIHEVVEEHTPINERDDNDCTFLIDPPSEWDEYETRLFDMLTEIEDKTKKEIICIVEGKK